jgi:hypothetical protein
MTTEREHLARRQAAFARAAEAHRHAAAVEDDAAALFTARGEVDAAEHHRTAAARQRHLADADAATSNEHALALAALGPART